LRAASMKSSDWGRSSGRGLRGGMGCQTFISNCRSSAMRPSLAYGCSGAACRLYQVRLIVFGAFLRAVAQMPDITVLIRHGGKSPSGRLIKSSNAKEGQGRWCGWVEHANLNVILSRAMQPAYGSNVGLSSISKAPIAVRWFQFLTHAYTRCYLVKIKVALTLGSF